MINFDDYTNENKTEHNSKWPWLMKNQPDIDKMYLYAKYPYEEKYQFLTNKRESTRLKHINDPKAFI